MKSCLITVVTLILAMALKGQNSKIVHLDNKPVNYAPVEFYINAVIDDRSEKEHAGKLTSEGKKGTIDMTNGVAGAFENFISANVKQNKNKQPLALHVPVLDINVAKTGGLWKTEIILTLSFYVGEKKLVDFTGKGKVSSDKEPEEYISNFLIQNLESDLKQFDEWWAQNKGEIPTAREVKVNVKLGRQIDKPYCIGYDKDRLLRIDDFRGPPKGEGREMAETMSGIGFGYTAKTENGQIVVSVTVTPYFDKSQSWFKEAGKNQRVLNHEQAHFDITAIKACELVKTIRNSTFTQENYKDLLEKLRNRNGDDTFAEENLYDDETVHGTVNDKQLEWERKLKEEVGSVGCF